MFAVIRHLLTHRASLRLYDRMMVDTNGGHPGGVRLIWLGTAGAFLTDGKTGLLIDPYVSRFGMGKILLNAPLRPDRELIKQWMDALGKDPVDAVIVSHSHYDHATDAPYFALAANAPLLGTQSTLNIGIGAGLPESKLQRVYPGQNLRFGNFDVTFIESDHGQFNGRVPYPGVIDRPLVPPAPASAYRLGAVFSMLIRHPSGSVIHHGSAGFKKGMYEGIHADAVLLGIAIRGNTDEYLKNVVVESQARVVFPIHLDHYFKPLEDGLSLIPGVDFQEFVQTCEKYRPDFTVQTLPLCGEVPILPFDGNRS